MKSRGKRMKFWVSPNPPTEVRVQIKGKEDTAVGATLVVALPVYQQYRVSGTGRPQGSPLRDDVADLYGSKLGGQGQRFASTGLPRLLVSALHGVRVDLD